MVRYRLCNGKRGSHNRFSLSQSGEALGLARRQACELDEIGLSQELVDSKERLVLESLATQGTDRFARRALEAIVTIATAKVLSYRVRYVCVEISVTLRAQQL